MRNIRKFSGLFLLCCITLLFAAFGMPATRTHAESMAYIRVIHASPDVGVVDVFVDGNKLLSSFQFGVVTPYVPLPAGGHHVQIALIGTGVGAAVITQSIMVQANTPYTVAAIGTKETGFSLTVFTDNNVVSNNDAKVRVYHLSLGTGTVNVTNGSTSVASDLSYQNASGYVDIPAGSYTLNAVIPNQTVSIPTNLQPWTITSVFAVGEVNGVPKLTFVSTQVKGIPGMPGTGSDPNAPSENENTAPMLPWTLGMLVVLVLVGGYAVRQYLIRS
jgi:hypothetical protein